MKKAYFVIFGIILLLVLGGGAVWWLLQPAETEEVAQPTLPPENFNQIAVEQRPYITLKPREDGRNITMVVQDMKLPATKGEYEIEYQTGTLLQGAGGRINVAKLPDTIEILLGSCSAGGKCTYHENVTGGSLITRFTNEDRISLKNEWAFIDNREDKSDTWSSQDGKFAVTGAGFTKIPFAIVFQTPGLPEGLKDRLVSAPYSVMGAKTVSGSVEVAIRLSEEAPNAELWAWNGKTWQKLKTTVKDKMATAPSATLMEAYAVVVPAEAMEESGSMEKPADTMMK